MFDDGTCADKVIEWESDMPSQVYIRNMRQHHQWGGGIEIYAFCELFSRCVSVYDIREDPPAVIRFKCQQPTVRKTLRINWNGTHFTPR
jgi:hypothetical protein